MQALKKLLRLLRFSMLNSISRATRFVAGKSTRALLVDSRQGLFLVDPEDSGVGRQLRYTGSYGQEEIDRILAYTNESTSVLFVGSHIGTLAIPVSKRVRKVCTIEANPETFQLLKWNLLLNDCANVTAIQLAASDKEEELQFLLSRANSGGSKRMPQVKDPAYFYDRPAMVKVQAARLDDALSEEVFDVIVMDIEGSEYFALKGMSRILAGASHLIVEFLPHHLKNVAGISVDTLLEPIAAHFDTLYIPSKLLTAERSQFTSVLARMFERDEEDDGVVFSRSRVPQSARFSVPI